MYLSGSPFKNFSDLKICVKILLNLLENADIEDLYKMDKYFFYDIMKMIFLNEVI
jgi:hypothetical protein